MSLLDIDWETFGQNISDILEEITDIMNEASDDYEAAKKFYDTYYPLIKQIIEAAEEFGEDVSSDVEEKLDELEDWMSSLGVMSDETRKELIAEDEEINGEFND